MMENTKLQTSNIKLQTSKSTRGVRNNNPLNIIVSKSQWVGKIADPTKKKDKVFEEFTTMAYGLRAAILLLRSYINKGYDTVPAIIHRWCPDHTACAYTRTVVSRMARALPGFDSMKPVAPTDRDTLYQLVRAMAYVESIYEVSRQEFDEALSLCEK